VGGEWWGLRGLVGSGGGVGGLGVGFVVGVYRHAIENAFVETAAAVGLASSGRDVAAEAETAFQKGDYAKALKLARPLAEDGNPRAEAVVGPPYYPGRGAGQSGTQPAPRGHRA